eukprot:1183192-Prorocentrum_minimum.AAC.2
MRRMMRALTHAQVVESISHTRLSALEPPQQILSLVVRQVSKFVVFMDYAQLRPLANLHTHWALTWFEQLNVLCFLALCVVLTYFLMLNFLLVIMADAMLLARGDTDEAPTVWAEGGGVLRFWGRRVTPRGWLRGWPDDIKVGRACLAVNEHRLSERYAEPVRGSNN